MCIISIKMKLLAMNFFPHQLGNGDDWNDRFSAKRDAESGRAAHQLRFLYVMEQSCPAGPGLLYKKETPIIDKLLHFGVPLLQQLCLYSN